MTLPQDELAEYVAKAVSSDLHLDTDESSAVEMVIRDAVTTWLHQSKRVVCPVEGLTASEEDHLRLLKKFRDELAEEIAKRDAFIASLREFMKT